VIAMRVMRVPLGIYFATEGTGYTEGTQNPIVSYIHFQQVSPCRASPFSLRRQRKGAKRKAVPKACPESHLWWLSGYPLLLAGSASARTGCDARLRL